MSQVLFQCGYSNCLISVIFSHPLYPSYCLLTVSWYRVVDGKPEQVTVDSQHHIEDYETTFCMEVKSTQEVDEGTYIVKAENEAGETSAEFDVIVKSKFLRLMSRL